MKKPAIVLFVCLLLITLFYFIFQEDPTFRTQSDQGDLTWEILQEAANLLSKKFGVDFLKKVSVSSAISLITENRIGMGIAPPNLKTFLTTEGKCPNGMVTKEEFLIFLFFINQQIALEKHQIIIRDFDPESLPEYSDVASTSRNLLSMLNMYGVNPFLSSGKLNPTSFTKTAEAIWSFKSLIYFHSIKHKIYFNLQKYKRKLYKYFEK